MRKHVYTILSAMVMLWFCGIDTMAQNPGDMPQGGDFPPMGMSGEMPDDMTGASKKKTKRGDEAADYVQQTAVMETQYLFGVAISPADSVTYITNITPVSGIKYDLRTKTPVGADLYTESLKNYLLQQGKKGYLCSTFMCKSMKKAEKKILSIRKKASKRKYTRLQSIGDFRYEYINTDFIFSNAGETVPLPGEGVEEEEIKVEY